MKIRAVVPWSGAEWFFGCCGAVGRNFSGEEGGDERVIMAGYVVEEGSAGLFYATVLSLVFHTVMGGSCELDELFLRGME